MLKEDKRQTFRSLLGFTEHDILKSKESSITEKIKTVFSATVFEKYSQILLQHSVFTYRIDLYFPVHKIAVEIDEIGHQNREIIYETQRQKAREQELVCVFI